MPPVPSMDHDQRIRRQHRIHWLVGLAGLGAYLAAMISVLGWAMALVATTPVLAGLSAYWLVQHGAGMPWQWLKRRAYAGTEGVFHAFDDLQVRVRWNGVCCEVAVRDVLAVLRVPADEQPKLARRLAARYPGGIHQYPQDAREGWFSEASLLAWLAERGGDSEPSVWRFRRWLERETFPAIHRKVERGLIPRDGGRR